MEKSWENFWTTGKVEDYLNYRNRVSEDENDCTHRRKEAKEIQDREDVTVQNRPEHRLF